MPNTVQLFYSIPFIHIRTVFGCLFQNDSSFLVGLYKLLLSLLIFKSSSNGSDIVKPWFTIGNNSMFWSIFEVWEDYISMHWISGSTKSSSPTYLLRTVLTLSLKRIYAGCIYIVSSNIMVTSTSFAVISLTAISGSLISNHLKSMLYALIINVASSLVVNFNSFHNDIYLAIVILVFFVRFPSAKLSYFYYLANDYIYKLPKNHKMAIQNQKKRFLIFPHLYNYLTIKSIIQIFTTTTKKIYILPVVLRVDES